MSGALSGIETFTATTREIHDSQVTIASAVEEQSAATSEITERMAESRDGGRRRRRERRRGRARRPQHPRHHGDAPLDDPRTEPPRLTGPWPAGGEGPAPADGSVSGPGGGPGATIGLHHRGHNHHTSHAA